MTHTNKLTGIISLLTIGVLAVNSARAATAVRMTDFLDSIGINTHMHQGETAANTAMAINYAGFRHLRDGGGFDASFMAKAKFVHDNTINHVKIVVIESGPDDAWLTNAINAGKTLANYGSGALLAMEGPNEPNNLAVTYQGQTSTTLGTFLPVANFQRDFYSLCKADPVLTNYPMFHSSEAGGSEPNNVGLQYLTIPSPLPSGVLMPAGTVYADYANVHNYINRKAPSDNMAWENASSDNVGWSDGIYAEYGVTWRKSFSGYTVSADRWALPKVATETGWPVGSYGLTEEQQGRIFLNCYFSQFKRGFKHTFIYMLRDTSAEPGYGFFTSSYVAKRAGIYLHNLTTILNDSGSTTPGNVNYSIPSQPATVHDLLLQKSNGTFYLAVWGEKVSGSTNVTVNLGATYATVKIYDPTVGISAIQTLNNISSIPLTLSDHPLILEFPGSDGGGAGLPSPWQSQDVGAVGTVGSATYASGTFTVNGSGTNISGAADAFQYVSLPVNRDCEIKARVVSQQTTSGGAEAGVMIRETLDANSKNVLTAVTNSSGVSFRFRTATGGGTAGPASSTGAVPYWVRLTRIGNAFKGYKSTDGTSWTLIGSVTISMTANVYAGLAVCSHVSTLGTATFDNVTIYTSPTPEALIFANEANTNLTLNWTQSLFKLQWQTNSLNVGLSTNWSDYPGGGTPPVNVPVSPTDPSAFYRLKNK